MDKNELKLRQIAEDLTIKYLGNQLAIGRYFLYRKGGKGPGVPIKIISGYFLDPTYNRLSNFWRWQQVLPDGSLEKKAADTVAGNRFSLV